MVTHFPYFQNYQSLKSHLHHMLEKFLLHNYGIIFLSSFLSSAIGYNYVSWLNEVFNLIIRFVLSFFRLLIFSTVFFYRFYNIFVSKYFIKRAITKAKINSIIFFECFVELNSDEKILFNFSFSNKKRINTKI